MDEKSPPETPHASPTKPRRFYVKIVFDLEKVEEFKRQHPDATFRLMVKVKPTNELLAQDASGRLLRWRPR